MTGRIKKAKKQRELDALVFNVLASFSALQWNDWYETTTTRRGEKGLGTSTFSNAVKRLMAEERVQIDGDGYYRVAYVAAENSDKTNPVVQDIADIALQQLMGLHS
jgi:hypothetical protein